MKFKIVGLLVVVHSLLGGMENQLSLLDIEYHKKNCFLEAYMAPNKYLNKILGCTNFAKSYAVLCDYRNRQNRVSIFLPDAVKIINEVLLHILGSNDGSEEHKHSEESIHNKNFVDLSEKERFALQLSRIKKFLFLEDLPLLCKDREKIIIKRELCKHAWACSVHDPDNLGIITGMNLHSEEMPFQSLSAAYILDSEFVKI